MIVNEKFHYFTVLTLYYDEFAGILPKTMQKICICGGEPSFKIYRPKTVGLMQDVFAADGDMAQVPAP